MVRFLKNPVVQFLAAGLVVLTAVIISSVQLSRRAADDEAVADARATTSLLAQSVAQPALPPGLLRGDAGAVDRFDSTARSRLLVGDVKRIKIWRADGTIVYSDEERLIHDRFPLGGDEQGVLRHGGSDAGVSDLTRPENRFETGRGGLLEVYTRIRSPEGTPLLFEAYYSAADIARRRQKVFDAFQPITVGGLLVLVAVTTPLLWAMTRRLERSARERERLFQAAADASEGERRRIARDLHDGVVQDLAGTSFALAATLRSPGTSAEVIERLTPMSETLRTSLRALRSTLVEIYPPDLGADGLAAALQDLVAPATAAGMTAAVGVQGLDAPSEVSLRLVWRVAQEATRNALRHSHATALRVQVRQVGNRLVLEVTDNGDGFVPQPGRGGIGLRALRDLVREAGGTIDVRSTPGRGTTVRLEVRR